MIELTNLHAAAVTKACVAYDAKTIGCETAALQAVMTIEARGRGFDNHGRLTALFEPHIFYKLLSAHMADALVGAVGKNLAYQTWGKEPYPADSYPRIEAARQISEEYAYQATSWGLPQILGMNFKQAGYNSAVALVSAFLLNENEQIDAMCRFIVASNLAGDLARHDWAAFALGYNGAGSAKNAYASKLAIAYAAARHVQSIPKAYATPTSVVKGTVVVAVGSSTGLLQWAQGLPFWEVLGFATLAMTAIAMLVYKFPKCVLAIPVKALPAKNDLAIAGQVSALRKPEVLAQTSPAPTSAAVFPTNSIRGSMAALTAFQHELDGAKAAHEAHKTLAMAAIANLGQALKEGGETALVTSLSAPIPAPST